MQRNLLFDNQQIQLPELCVSNSIGCGSIHQLIVEQGDFTIAAGFENSDGGQARNELDLENCPLPRIELREGSKSKVDSKLPCVFTDSALGSPIRNTSWAASASKSDFWDSRSILDSWEDSLIVKREVRDKSKGFRNAQVGAIHALLSHWSVSDAPSTVVLPTGTGKTETMLGATIADCAELTLVIVPSQELRAQISAKFRQFGILKEIGVLKSLARFPRVATLTSSLRTTEDLKMLLTCNVIVTTPLLLAKKPKLLRRLAESVSHVYFDEAHHIKANSWAFLKTAFSGSKVVQFTATPYRLDRKPIEGKVVYQYPLDLAQKDGCFSDISLITVDERNPAKKDEAIADAAYARLSADRKEGFGNHCMMVRVKSKNRANEILEIYRSKFPEEAIEVVCSGISGKREKIKNIKEGKYSIVICVDMLKEGFDHPEFKIAAVHDLHKSLAVAMQFIGRFTRDREDLGKAHMIVNFAETEIPRELEKLYAEGTGWSKVISEVAQSKQEEAIKFIDFLSNCKPFKTFDDPEQLISPRLVNPALSCVVYRCERGVDWSGFANAFTKKFRFSQPYENSPENLFYFTVQAREPVKWTKSEAIRDQLWTLVLMHYSEEQKLLYIGCSNSKFKHQNLAEAVCKGAYSLVNLNPVFRSFQNIKRLKIIHAGLLKPANRNHRYSKYSGADVTTQLEILRSGGRVKKSDFVGAGYRDGKPVGVGASQKGKVWNPARVGNPQQWIEWCEMTGGMLIDENINPDQLFEDSAKVSEIDQFPTSKHIIAMDWNEEIFEKHHRISLLSSNGSQTPLFLCEFGQWEWEENKLRFVIERGEHDPIKVEIELGGEDGHTVRLLDTAEVFVSGWVREDEMIEKFFVDFPPTVFLADGSILSGCQHTEFQSSGGGKLPDGFFDPWDWSGIDIETEAAYKHTKDEIVFRPKSIQQRVMEVCKADGATLVYNDDGSGESADVVAFFEEESSVKINLLHCKFSGESFAGHRVKDIYEVCGQAVKSVKWKWDAKALIRHLQNRRDKGLGRERRFFHGSSLVLADLLEKLKYSDVIFQFTIVQPGLSSKEVPQDLQNILVSTATTIADMTESRLCFVSS